MILKKSIIVWLLSLALAIGFATSSMVGASEPQPRSLVADLRGIEATIKYDTPENSYFGYIAGTIPVLISAPHGAKHFRTREDRFKAEDAYTASMAIELGRMTGAYVIYTQSKAPEAPNNDYHTEYKDFLAKVVQEKGIKFVMDLHGSQANRPYTIDVGTFTNVNAICSCPLVLDTIRHALLGLDNVHFNTRFTANGRGTITYFAHTTLGIDAAQFEINSQYRIPRIDPASPDVVKNERQIAAAVEALDTVVRDVNNAIREERADVSPNARP